MKKIVFGVLIFITLLLLGISFNKIGFSKNETLKLQSDYIVWNNDNGLVLGKKYDVGNFVIVKENVVKIAQEEGYIFAQKEFNNDIKYYVIDVKNNQYIDELNQEDFDGKLKELNFTDLEWNSARDFCEEC